MIIIVSIFNTISSTMSNNMEHYQKYMNLVAYPLITIYSAMVLYSITMTAESAFEKLKNLTITLQQRMVKEKDHVEQMKIRFLIEKVEKTKPLSGNGYFEVSKLTLASITSISITYLIILLQFRTA